MIRVYRVEENVVAQEVKALRDVRELLRYVQEELGFRLRPGVDEHIVDKMTMLLFEVLILVPEEGALDVARDYTYWDTKYLAPLLKHVNPEASRFVALATRDEDCRTSVRTYYRASGYFVTQEGMSVLQSFFVSDGALRPWLKSMTFSGFPLFGNYVVAVPYDSNPSEEEVRDAFRKVFDAFRHGNYNPHVYGSYYRDGELHALVVDEDGRRPRYVLVEGARVVTVLDLSRRLTNPLLADSGILSVAAFMHLVEKDYFVTQLAETI